MIETMRSSLIKHTMAMYYLIGFLMIGVSVASRLLFNGTIFRFDYHLYQPDGALYTYMSLKFTGDPETQAAHAVIDWYSRYAEPGLLITPDYFDPNENPALWALVGVRFVYPILSLPFVMILGIPGMLVVPILSLCMLVWVTLRMGVRSDNKLFALMLVFLLTNSSTVTRWFIANLTDGVLAGIVALTLWILITQSRFHVPLLILGILFASFTRFSLPIWLGVSVFLLINRKRALSLITLLTSVLGFLPALLVRPDLSFVAPKPDQDVTTRIIEFVLDSFKLLFVEVAQLAALDRPLLFVLATALLASLMQIRRSSSQAFLIMTLAVWFIGAINPVLGVNFRYQLPLIIFAVWVILDNLQIRGNRTFGDALNIKSDKAD